MSNARQTCMLLSSALLLLGPASHVLAGVPCDDVEAELLLGAPLPMANGRFGAAIDLSGDTLACGAVENTSSAAPDNVGSVWVYTGAGADWALQQRVQADDGLYGDHFGAAVALDADVLAVGAPRVDAPGAQDAGAIYVFERVGTTWAQVARFDSPAPLEWGAFGGSLALDGERLLVGEPGGDGHAYVYERQAGSWSLAATIDPPPFIDFSADFGSDVALVGDVAVIGAEGHDASGSYDQGSAWILEQSGASWSVLASLEPSDGATGTYFGRAVAFDGARLAIGAATGSVYVYDFGPGGPGPETRLSGCGAPPPFGFGRALALQGDRLVVGASPGDGAHVFHRTTGGWAQQARLVSSADADGLGTSVAAQGEQIVMGAPEADGPFNDQGAASVHVLPVPGTWSDLGAALPGALGAPVASGAGALSAGSPASLSLSGGQPAAAAWLVLGLSPVSAPFKGGTLVPEADVLWSTGLDATGGLDVPFAWPAGLPLGWPLWMQVWIADASGPVGWTASNALLAVAE